MIRLVSRGTWDLARWRHVCECVNVVPQSSLRCNVADSVKFFEVSVDQSETIVDL